MKTVRWLLPFTHGMDMGAIDSLVQLAASAQAKLVAVSLIAIPKQRYARGVRLEYVQQSKDFLEAVSWVAARHGVPVERHEVTTADVLQQIQLLIHELDCDSITLASRPGKEILLHSIELKHLLEEPPARLVLVRIAGETPPHILDRLLTRVRLWLHKRLGLYDETSAWHDLLDDEVSVWIRTELSPRR